MGLLQAAFQTYESYASKVGVINAAEKEPLTPIAHFIQKAQLEISITEGGQFITAESVPKEAAATIIPVTLESASRTNSPIAHPLCDQLCYLSDINVERHQLYCQQLSKWANSEFSHPKVKAVWKYIQSGTILKDLESCGLLHLTPEGKLKSSKIENTNIEKCLIRWRVVSSSPEKYAVWEDTSLFESYANYYLDTLSAGEQDICMISGNYDIRCDTHPKGLVSANFGAKLISSNDASGFTFRGRFAEATQAESVSYNASQKAHSALRWVSANSGIVMGGRTFICWNPDGAEVPVRSLFGIQSKSRTVDFVSYRKELESTLSGYKLTLPGKKVIIAALDAATTGRLSVTYYNELEGSDFIRRLEFWYSSCCCDTGQFGIQSPSVWLIVNYALGSERGDRIEADARIVKEHTQQILRCIVDSRSIPYDIMKGISVRASNPLAYNYKNRTKLLWIACALIRKYYNDKAQKEEWKLALDLNNRDRSYLFGRLLAIAEMIERDTYGKDEQREPNAIRMQTLFSQRPMYTWRRLEDKLSPYMRRLYPGSRKKYRAIIEEIMSLLSADDTNLNKALDDVYLLGYWHQRTELYRGTNKINENNEIEMEENEE